MSQWMDLSWSSNRNIRSYYNGFVDISGGNLYLRGFNTGIPNSNCHLFINNGDISLNGRMYASGDVSINQRLCVGLDVSLNNRLFVGGDVSINSRLFVGSDTIIYGRLSVNEYISDFIINTTTSNYTFILAEDMSLNGRLTVYLDTSMNSRLNVGGDVSLNSRLTVYSDVSLNSRLFIGNDVSLNGSLFVSNYIGIGVSGSIYQLGISGGTTICQLDVSGVSNFRGPVYPLTLVDNSVLLTNNREFDFSNSFGVLWTQTTTSNINWTSIAISATGQFQIACNYGTGGFSDAGTYISNNYGLTWTQVSNGSASGFNPYTNSSFKSVAISSSGKYMLALQYSTGTDVTAYVSSNYGSSNSWSQVSSFITTNTPFTSSRYLTYCAMSSTGQYQVILQNYGTTFPNNNVFISNNYGNTFTYTLNNNTSGSTTFLYAAISSNGQYITVVGSSGIYNSNSFGQKNTWTTNTTITNVKCVTMSANGQYQYCGTSTYVYFSNNYGISWTSLNAPYNINWASISVTSNGQYVVAAQNVGNVYTSNNFGGSWTLSNAGSYNWNCVVISSNSEYITACQSNYTSTSTGYIYNSITPYSNISVSNVVCCYNDASFNNRLFVGNIANIGGNINVIGLTSLGNTLTVTGATTINSTLGVPNALTTLHSLTVNNATTLSSTFTVNGTTNLNSTVNMLGGTVTIGNSTDNQNFVVNGTGNITSTLIVTGVTTMSSNATVAGTLDVTGASTFSSTVGVTGQCTAASFNANSDYRIKENIRDLNENFTIDTIRPVEYNMKDSNEKSIGVIAHELQEFYPFLVNGQKDGDIMQSVNYIGIIPLLINEVKLLKKEMKVLKTAVHDLLD